ncbi:hypothetical protein BDV26DRAFT_206209 [Aspergillus bertholletiae]|uniref:Transmembrane protein n=1 Tax=Aspergillus bertholletiae TaxID=1226010 RepID=A0A5N7B798_9EURO|nr:hypothetical protein BDV26DRAFT_206209 [Aspergillus bertholletiae]
MGVRCNAYKTGACHTDLRRVKVLSNGSLRRISNCFPAERERVGKIISRFSSLTLGLGTRRLNGPSVALASLSRLSLPPSLLPLPLPLVLNLDSPSFVLASSVLPFPFSFTFFIALTFSCHIYLILSLLVSLDFILHRWNLLTIFWHHLTSLSPSSLSMRFVVRPSLYVHRLPILDTFLLSHGRTRQRDRRLY